MKIIKKIIWIILIAFLTSISTKSQARGKKINSIIFKVKGVCGMCESRIEKASLIKGVRFSDWNKKSEVLIVIYNIRKTSELKIHEAIANAGHDTDLVKASKDAYKNLPECCKYLNKIMKH